MYSTRSCSSSIELLINIFKLNYFKQIMSSLLDFQIMSKLGEGSFSVVYKGSNLI